MYDRLWGAPLALASREFYAGRSAGVLASAGVTMAAYSRVANQWLAEEEARGLAMPAPPPSSATGAATNNNSMYLACVEVLAVPHTERLLAELSELLAYQCISLGGPEACESAGSIFRLVMRTGDAEGAPAGLEAAMAGIVEAAVSRALAEVIAPALDGQGILHSRDTLMSTMEAILARKDFYSTLASKVFDSLLVMEAVERAARVNLALLPSPAECLARFCDLRLRKLAKEGDEVVVAGAGAHHQHEEPSHLDLGLERALRLVRVLESKDEFQRFYTQFLCRRLLAAATATDLETLAVSRMTVDRGYEFTRRMERLIADMASTDLAEGYAKWDGRDRDEIDLSVRVVASNLWPLTIKLSAVNLSSACLPPSLQRARASLAAYYASVHGGRRLTWLDALSSVTARTRYLPTRQYDLVLTVHQLAVLLAFDRWPLDHAVSLAEISACTALPAADCQGCLSALAEAGVVAVAAAASGAAAQPPACYSLSSAFASKRTKVRVPTSTHSESLSRAEDIEAAKHLAISRNYELEATLVRTLKAKRSIPSKELFAEVISQLVARFLPTREMYKTALERIIERGYAKRADDAPEIIEYVA